jgi:hypothetical protein
MSENTRRPLTTKVHLYQALYLFNRGFEITLAGLKRLEELGVFRQENLSDYEVRLEATRAIANEELTSVMQSYEEDDTTYWDNRYRDREKEMRDPDDVFFDARDRREEIKEQIRELQSGLARQQPKRSSPKRKRRKPKPKQKTAA